MLMRIRRKDASGRGIAVLRNQPKLVDHPLVGLRQPAELDQSKACCRSSNTRP